MSIASVRILVASAVVATIAVAASNAIAKDYKETREFAVDHLEGTPVHVESSNGSIEIRSYDGEKVVVEAKIKSKSAARLEEAVVLVEREGKKQVLDVSIRWPGKKWKNGDSCSFTVLVPDANGVAADTSNGSITISGLAGQLSADTSNGSITVEHHGGPVSADTSNGSITVTDAAGRVSADTSNGSITVLLAGNNPGPVDLDTSNGSVTLEVGPAFVGTVTADTSVGRVSFGPFPADLSVEVEQRAKTEGKAVFGNASTPRSKIDTSVGSVTVKARAS